MNELIFSICFLLFIFGVLMLDLGVFNRKSHVISFKEAGIWTGVWIALSLLMWVFIRFYGDLIHGIDSMDKLLEINAKHMHNLPLDLAASLETNLQIYRNAISLEYITGYLIEKALSFDNIFVMIMVFVGFGVDQKYYHKVLFWGILGAVVMRFILIFLSSALIHRFEWTLAIFGGLLIFTAIKMFLERNKEETINIENHLVVRLMSKRFRMVEQYHGDNFFIKQGGHRFMTPLFIVLIVIEFTDVIFAVDSVPAIFAITKDPYIVFFSNIFAILGLRSLFFFLSNMMNKFHYLKHGLSVLLAFIGVKMIVHVFFHLSIGTMASLFIILGILAVSVAASLLFPKKEEENTDKTLNS